MEDGIGIIKLRTGESVLIDIEDKIWLVNYKWYSKVAPKTTYASRNVCQGHTISMHREIMNAPPGFEVDHINKNGLDNRKSNLRIVSIMQNRQNRQLGANNTSGFKGVYFNKKTEKWHAQIRANKKKLYLGGYLTQQRAAEAYDTAAIKYFGEFALTNKILKESK